MPLATLTSVQRFETTQINLGQSPLSLGRWSPSLSTLEGEHPTKSGEVQQGHKGERTGGAQASGLHGITDEGRVHRGYRMLVFSLAYLVTVLFAAFLGEMVRSRGFGEPQC